MSRDTSGICLNYISGLILIVNILPNNIYHVNQSRASQNVSSIKTSRDKMEQKFQVMSGLKRVEDQKMELKKSSSTSSLDPAQTASKEVSELGGGKNQDRNGNGSIKGNSSDKKVRKKVSSAELKIK